MSIFSKTLKTSSTRASRRQRNKNGRKIRVEKLGERKLMAADFGGLGDFYGPLSPVDDAAAEVSTMNTTSASQGSSNLVSVDSMGQAVEFELIGGELFVTGTNQHDNVTLTNNYNTGMIEFSANSYDYWGILVGQATGTVAMDEVSQVRADMHQGNDVLNANIGVTPVIANGGYGNDTLISGNGDDQLRGDQGNDVLRGGYGNDVLNGGSQNDRIYGGYGNDIISGESGNDILEGQGDHDRIWGGDGDDTIRGGDGDDAIYAENGHDRVFAQAGNDFISGGAGNDLLSRGNGNDILHGDDGNDTMHGNGGNDTMMGWNGNDYMYGGSGSDKMYGKEGTDELRGGSGNDLLDGGDDGNRDRLYGQSGRDTFVKHEGFWSDDPDVFLDYVANNDLIHVNSWWSWI